MFRCQSNNILVPLLSLSDGVADCPDRSDEQQDHVMRVLCSSDSVMGGREVAEGEDINHINSSEGENIIRLTPEGLTGIILTVSALTLVSDFSFFRTHRMVIFFSLRSSSQR